MYEFQYGVMPTDQKNCEYCQLKGDAGLYKVSHIDKDNQTATLDSHARVGEVHHISKLRFISQTRLEIYESTKKHFELTRDPELIPGKPLFELKLKNGSIKLREVLKPFGEIGYATLKSDEIYALTVEDANGSNLVTSITNLRPFGLAKANLQMSEFNDETPVEDILELGYTILFNVHLGQVYFYENPIQSKKLESFIVTKLDKNGVTITNLTSKMEKGKRETRLTGFEHYFLDFDEEGMFEYDYRQQRL